jgi:dimethylglycine dehydrogenase
MTGGVTIASTPDGWEWLQATYRVFQTISIRDCHLMTPEEVKKACPIMDIKGFISGLWADREGYLDTTGTVHAYAGAAKKRGVTVIEHSRVLELNQRPDGTWNVVTGKGTITPSTWSMPAAFGPSRSAAWSGWSYQSRRLISRP